MSTRDRTDGHAAPHPTERTALLPTRSLDSSSSESPPTGSSLHSSFSDSESTLRYIEPCIDPELAITRDEPLTAAPSGKKQDSGHGPILKAIGILVIGVFTGNADGSFVLATHSTIASEFNSLEASSWLITAFALAGASSQNIVRRTQHYMEALPVIQIPYSPWED